MSVKLRLKRFGRRHEARFRLGAMDTRSPRDGRVIEQLGWFNPEAKDPAQQVNLKRERIEYWLAQGAQPSDTVRELLARNGIGVGAAALAAVGAPEAAAAPDAEAKPPTA